MKASPFTVMGSAGPSTAEWRLAGHESSTELLYLESRRVSTAGDLQLNSSQAERRTHVQSGNKKNPNGHTGKGSIIQWDCHQSPPAVGVSGGTDGMLVPCQEKRYQGKAKAGLDETEARCWKILWSVTAEQRRECEHETTLCTSQLLHTSAPLTHQHTWTILLVMDTPPDTLLP